ncbi:hypothetical protein [Devosia chinhatensis]|uniref:hypothetical protein n=1 Tax=Devosia chinhatensis TaxID=429727 RepID=UPI000ACC81B0|nr:hypothetical protein [Devosia chinhatensis]
MAATLIAMREVFWIYEGLSGVWMRHNLPWLTAFALLFRPEPVDMDRPALLKREDG